MYEYQCRHCGRRFERIEKFSDDTHPECECGQQAERLISPPAIQFKGSGWYVTDYARKSAPSETKGESGGSADKSSDKSSDKGRSADKTPAADASKPSASKS